MDTFKSALFVLFGSCFLQLSGCASASAPLQAGAAEGTWSGGLLASTKNGYLLGLRDREKTISWKGIPYAAPPVGDLRWKAPRESEAWKGVRRAYRFGSPAVQSMPFIGLTGSEDCLYLNIWRPDTNENNLPVYVYVHGGGNTLGMASMAEYHGYAVAARSNMVYVSINYRLGVFGWFRNPGLGEVDGSEDASGNYGTLDIISSLLWIQKNIASFGGDSARVTLTGESAGAMNIMSLLLSPLAKGLFQGAVLQSGSATMPKLADADKAGREFLAKILIKDHKAVNAEAAEALIAAMNSDEIRSYLAGKSPRQLMAVLKSRSGGLGMLDYPTIYPDGFVIPSQGYKAFTEGSYPVKVPLVLGTNGDEVKLFMSMAKNTGLSAENYEKLARLRTDSWRYRGVDSLARAITRHQDQPPVYSYRFDWGIPDARGRSPMPGAMGTRLGAFHSIEVPFFLGTDTNTVTLMTGNYYTAKNRDGRRELSAVIMDYLASFAKTGDPNGGTREKRLTWVPWSMKEDLPQAIVFDVDGSGPSITVSSETISKESLRDYALREIPEALRSAELKSLDSFTLE